MTPAAEAPRPAPRPAHPAFLGGFALANVGVFASFLPQLQILMPLKAAQIAPHAAAELLSWVALVGALVAGATNLAVGAASDRTRSRFGRRRPWMLLGALGAVASYGLIFAAHTPLALVGALAMFQIAFNVLFAPFLALIPDRVPRANRGWASSLVALGHPIGAAIGAVVIGAAITGEAHRYVALGLIVLLTVVPFTLRLAPGAAPSSASESVEPMRAQPDVPAFWLGWIGRSCVIVAFSIVQTYLLYYVQETLGGRHAAPHAAEHRIALLGLVFGGATAVSCLVCGRLSDRTARRRPFVILGATMVGAGMLALALAPNWPTALVAYGLYGLGAGCHTVVDFAMMVDLLPSQAKPARDLGVLNLSNIAPQILAPLIGAWMLTTPGADVRGLLVVAAFSATTGAACVGLMRRVR